MHACMLGALWRGGGGAAACWGALAVRVAVGTCPLPPRLGRLPSSHRDDPRASLALHAHPRPPTTPAACMRACMQVFGEDCAQGGDAAAAGAHPALLPPRRRQSRHPARPLLWGAPRLAAAGPPGGCVGGWGVSGWGRREIEGRLSSVLSFAPIDTHRPSYPPPTHAHLHPQVRFLVMGNVLPSDLRMHRCVLRARARALISSAASRPLHVHVLHAGRLALPPPPPTHTRSPAGATTSRVRRMGARWGGSARGPTLKPR